MRNKDLKVYSRDREFLKSIAEDYRYLGYDVSLGENTLTVFSTKRKKQKKNNRIERDKHKSKNHES